MTSLITITIPTYKRLNYLKEAVTSALDQTYDNIEVLIGQDPTPQGLDESIQIWSQDLAAQNPKVRYQFNPQNLGLAGNWNALAAGALGEYLVMIGDDDRLLPDFVENLVKVVQAETQVAFSNHYVIDSQGNRLGAESTQLTKRYHRDRLPAGPVSNPEIWAWQNAIPMSAALVRTCEIQRLRFKADLNTPEIELFIRLAQAGGEFVFVPEYLAEYRVHEQAATASGLKVDKLVAYLLPMKVSPEVEPYKQTLLSQMIITGVSRCLMQGEIDQAKAFISSHYYPSSQITKNSRCALQKLCTALPGNMGSELYKLIHVLRRTRSSV